MGKVARDETLKMLVDQMAATNSLLGGMVRNNLEEFGSKYSDITRLVASGVAPKIINIGDQIVEPWSDGTKSYEAPHNVVHFGDVVLPSGNTAPGMFLQWAYATPYGMPFDAPEAFYCAKDAELPAGTYHVTFAKAWSKAEAGSYQFTLTQPVPVGGLLAGFEQAADNTVDRYRVRSYAASDRLNPIETVTVSKGSGGTDLGTMEYTTTGALNSMHRTFYGYNRWSKSVIRQWLNSAAPAGQWWNAQHDWDMPPAELVTKPGFLSGYSAEFIAAIMPVRVRTALNTVEGLTETYEDTFDRIFLPSLEQEYIEPQLAGVEGEIWEYWRAAVERPNRTPWYKTFAEGGHPITYAIDNKVSAQLARLRSASRGFACYAWSVNASGSVSSSNALWASRCAPACVFGVAENV